MDAGVRMLGRLMGPADHADGGARNSIGGDRRGRPLNSPLLPEQIMVVTHSTASRDAATNAVVDQLDGAGSKLVFRKSPSSVGSPGTACATLTFATPAFGASSSGTATSGAIATGNASPVAYATLETSGSVVAIHCEVAASASDINMTGGLTVEAGDTVACSSLTYCALPA
jgi:hypothetical protein